MELAKDRGFCCIALAAALSVTSFGWWHQAQKADVLPIAITFDQYGTPGKIFIPADFTPTEAMKTAFLKRWVLDAFRKSPDQRVNIERREWLSYATGGQANGQYEPWFKENMEPAYGRGARIVMVKPTANPMIFDVTWDERAIDKSNVEGPWHRFNGDFTLAYRKQKTSEEVAQNEFGLYVVSLSRTPINEVVR